MILTIKYLPHLERNWLLKRINGKYSQHAHFYTQKEAILCRTLIDNKRYPTNKKYWIAMKRILTEREFKNLNKKPKCVRRNYRKRY